MGVCFGSGGVCWCVSRALCRSVYCCGFKRSPLPSAGCHPYSADWASAGLTSAYGGAAGSIWCFTNRKVILRSCQHLSASITHTRTNTHRSATQPYAHTHANTNTQGSGAHKAVNNRKWYVAEKVSVQLDSANTALFFHSSFIFSVHVDMSSIFSARPEVFTPSKGYLSGWCLWLCIFPLLLTSCLPQTWSTFGHFFWWECETLDWTTPKKQHFQSLLNWWNQHIY